MLTPQKENARNELRQTLRKLLEAVKEEKLPAESLVQGVVSWSAAWGVRITQDMNAHLAKAFEKTLSKE